MVLKNGRHAAVTWTVEDEFKPTLERGDILRFFWKKDICDVELLCLSADAPLAVVRIPDACGTLPRVSHYIIVPRTTLGCPAQLHKPPRYVELKGVANRPQNKRVVRLIENILRPLFAVVHVTFFLASPQFLAARSQDTVRTDL